MSQFGNVVALSDRSLTAPRRAPAPRRIPAGPLSAFEQAFCAIPLSSVVVTQGVMQGEPLETHEDFIVGDSIALDNRDGQLASNDHTHAPLPANAIKVDCATVRTLSDFADVLRMIALDETGCGHLCYAVTPHNAGMRAPYVLLPRALPANRKLTLIKANLI